MDYLNSLKNGLKVLFFKEDAVNRLAEEPKATKYGFETIVITDLIISVYGLIFLFVNYKSWSLGSFETTTFSIILLEGFFVWFIVFPLILLIPIIVFHLLSKYIGKGKASLAQYFRVAANASLVPFVLLFLDLTMLIPDCPFGNCLMYSTLSTWMDIKNLLMLLWLLAANIFVIKKVYGFSSHRAVIMGLLPPALFLVIVQLYNLVSSYMAFGHW